jgi:hypothetical protein
VRRHLVGVDRRSLCLGQPAGGEDLLNHGVLPAAVLVDGRGRGADESLDRGVLLPESRVPAQGLPDRQVITQGERARNNDVRVCPGQPLWLP